MSKWAIYVAPNMLVPPSNFVIAYHQCFVILKQQKQVVWDDQLCGDTLPGQTSEKLIDIENHTLDELF